MRPEVPPLKPRDSGTDGTSETTPTTSVTTPTNVVLETKPNTLSVTSSSPAPSRSSGYRANVSTPTSSVSQVGVTPQLAYQTYQTAESLSYQTHSSHTQPGYYSGRVGPIPMQRSMSASPGPVSYSVHTTAPSAQTPLMTPSGAGHTISSHVLHSSQQPSHPIVFSRMQGGGAYQMGGVGMIPNQPAHGQPSYQGGVVTAQPYQTGAYQTSNPYSQQFGQPPSQYDGMYYTSSGNYSSTGGVYPSPSGNYSSSTGTGGVYPSPSGNYSSSTGTGGVYPSPSGTYYINPSTYNYSTMGSGPSQSTPQNPQGGSGPMQRRNSPTHPNNNRYGNSGAGGNPNQ